MTVLDREMITAPDWRIDGRGKVTGATLFAGDVTRDGVLHAAFLGSPYPHAKILSIDTTAARAMPGVRAVLTGADVRPARFGRRVQDWPVLCWDRVRLVGDRVAAVAAETREQAEAAARAIVVRFEELPAILDPEAALAAGATALHPEAGEYAVVGGQPRAAQSHANIQGSITHEHGDLEEGFRHAARIFEHTFTLARKANGYVEPRASVVWIEGSIVHVVSTNKSPFALRSQLALTLGLPAEQVDVEPVAIGGDFGGKGLSIDEPALYFLARATGRPVRAAFLYSDELRISGARRAARIRVRTGFDRDGRITAHEARILYDGGAYAAGGPLQSIIPSEISTLAGYRVPAARIEALGAYTNSAPGGSDRAPGQAQVSFAGESHMDMVARELGIDPLEFRERNLAQPGEIDVLGVASHGNELPAVLATLRSESRWGTSLPEGYGRGVVIGLRHVGRGHATLALSLAPDGTIEVLTGLPEQGTGSFTVMQRVIAHELGIAPERVLIRQGSTADAAEDPGHGGSKSTAVHGGAALDGARKLKAALAEQSPGVSFDDAAKRVAPLEVIGIGDQQERLYSAYAEAVVVAVDQETGEMRIEDAVLVADTGFVINPVAIRGQLEGGFIYGLGQAVMEEIVFDEGRVINANLGDYKLPTSADVPPLRVFLHSAARGPGPYGSKGVGELANPGVGAAIANAVADACGARVQSLPITAEKIFTELHRPTQ